jgi:phosphatidylinositol glycan class N
MLAYSGWMAYALSLLLAPTAAVSSFLRAPVPLAALGAAWALFAARTAPATFYAYAAFPAFFWHHALARLRTVTVPSVGGRAVLWRAVQLTAALASLLAMVVRRAVASDNHALTGVQVGYTHRAVWAAGFVLIGVGWPLAAWPAGLAARHRALSAAWPAACVLAAVFPLLSVDKAESVPLMYVCSLLEVQGVLTSVD